MPAVAFDDELLKRLREIPSGGLVTFTSESDADVRLTFVITQVPERPTDGPE